MSEISHTDRPAYVAALAMTRDRHEGKLDDFGSPYYHHFVRVAARLVELFPEATDAQIQAALLHDVFEPALPYDEQHLLSHGVIPRAVEIIRRITLPSEPFDYLDYVHTLVASGDMEAMQVKLADNADALDYFPRLDEKDVRRQLISERYRPTRDILATALGI